MSSRASNWIVAVGGVILVGGLCFVPAIIERRQEIDLLAVGSYLFGVGALATASGIYMKAWLLKVATGQTPAARNTRGGCELCATESPVVHCKVHQLNLCGNCLAKHYDFRSCTYVPSSRGAGKSARKAAAAGALNEF